MRRLFHWGPLIALSIIKCITLTTLYYTGLWLSLMSNWQSMLNYLIYYLLLATTLYNFLCSIFSGPGYVPEQWRPNSKESESFLQYCHQCNAFKAPRSHHCSKCKRCILKMDHHCPWINNCCGYKNQRYFFNFLLSSVVGSIHSSTLLIITLYRALTFMPNENNRYIYLTLSGAFLIIISIGFSIGVIIAVGFLLYLQAKIIITNRTSIEDWIVKKADMRKREQPFIYPYDLGIWQNIRQVIFNEQSKGAGIEWPVKDGCDQFTLTYEQLQQKQDKMENASMYRVVRAYNGRMFPLFSQGFRVCISFPINDDPRLVIAEGDEVLVTHSYKYWLYGRKTNTLITKSSSETSKKLITQKGWFPKQCAVLMIKPNIINQHKQSTNENKDITGGDENQSKKDR